MNNVGQSGELLVLREEVPLWSDGVIVAPSDSHARDLLSAQLGQLLYGDFPTQFQVM